MGTGQHLSNLALGQVLVPTLKHWYAYQLVYPIAVGLVKFSILSQYYRIFEVVNFRKQVIAVGVFVAVYTVVCIFVNAFECHSKPWRAWDPTFPEGCNNLPATYFSTAAITIFTDLVILVMPLPQLMKLNLHRRRKYSPLVWVGVLIAIISASASSLRPLFYRIFKGSSYGRQRPSNSPYAGYGTYGNGESNFRRTITGAGTHHGVIELTSRDDDTYARTGLGASRSTSKAQKRTVDDENSSQELILDQNANIMKTVVIEMKSEDR
ncbi:hypothetical protein BJX64DRAFT_288938 [Aspergillus heterothallicus]